MTRKLGKKGREGGNKRAQAAETVQLGGSRMDSNVIFV